MKRSERRVDCKHYRAHHYKKKTEVAVTRIKNGGLQNRSTASGCTVGTKGLLEKSGTAKEKLDLHCQERSEAYGHYLG